MSRSYWSLILAIAGLILVGAGEPPKSSEHAQNTETQKHTNKAANPAPSPFAVEIVNTAEKDGGCKDRKDNRDSDLCAQWKAADAATNAAQYAFWTLLISAIGTGLLVWTLWETRQSSRRELRAYVKLVIPDTEVIITADTPVVIKLEMLNYGHTPALNCTFQHSCVIQSSDWQWPPSVSPVRAKNIGVTLHRDEPITSEIRSSFEINSKMISNVQDGHSTIFARAAYFYDDVFGKSHFSQMSFEITNVELGTKRIRVARIGNIST